MKTLKFGKPTVKPTKPLFKLTVSGTKKRSVFGSSFLPYAKRADSADREALDRLNAYIDGNEAEPIRLLYRLNSERGNAVTYAEIREIIEGLAVPAAIVAQWRETYSEFVTEKLAPVWRDAMKAGAESAAETFKLKETYSFSFEPEREPIRNWINTNGARWVTNETETVKSAIREMVRHASESGSYTTAELAKLIRPTIGLTERQAAANMRYYENVKRSLTENHPRMTAQSVEAKARDAAMKYAGKQHRYRAEMIARTEMAFAYNRGGDEAIKQAMEKGMLGKMRRKWSAAPGCCEICGDLDGQTVDMDSTFEFQGRILFAGMHETPPAHPNCRCVLLYEEVEPPGFGGLTNADGGGIINDARENDLFANNGETPDGKITGTTIISELEKSEAGRNALETLENLPERPIIDYETVNPYIKAQEESGAIRLFVKSCKDNTTAACALIHEATHYKYGIGQSQWAECVCVAQELKHRRGRNYLTFSERRTIIKAVKAVYPEYNWRKGGIVHGRRTK